MGDNKTTIAVGAVAGAIGTVIAWAVSTGFNVIMPTPVVGAVVVITTFVICRFVPSDHSVT